MSTKVNGSVTLHISDAGVAVIRFFHPAQNSLPSALLAELSAAILKAGSDPAAKVIVLQSDGNRTFCAGASFDELLSITDAEQGAAFFDGFARVINTCRKVPKLIIARVQGKAVGGGVGLACAADYVLATTAAAVKLSELAIGIGPFVISPAVVRKVGMAAFSQLTIKATEFQSAEWAKQHGLYNEIYDTQEELDDATNILANQLAAYHPEAMANLKEIFWEGTDNWDALLTERAAVSGKLVLSEFTQQALQKFLGNK
ncbi:enoyl-CoA hydratase/isomerase family protein [Mucilaginibacter koreensis]